MKTPLLVLIALTAAAVADDDVIPVAFSKDRYADMAGRSPFVVATPVEAPKEEKVDPFANVYLRGLGSDYVVIQRVGDDHTIRITGGEMVDGYTVKKINWSDTPGASTVTVTKGSDEGTLEFNKNELRATAPPPGVSPLAGGARRPVQGPGGMNVPPGATIAQPPNAPKLGGTPVSSIPRPSTPAVQPQAQPPRPTFGNQQGQGQGGQRQYGQGGQRGTGGNNGGSNDATGGRTRIRDLRQIQNR